MMTLPNFLVLGPGKTGTSWLYRCLREHPQIYLARNTKETAFFTDYYDRGIDWYVKFFDAAGDARAIGEIGNTYFCAPAAAARIAEHLPNARLIIFLRDPIDRIVSLYLFRRRNGLLRGSLNEAVNGGDPTIIGDHFYDEHLARYFAAFPREQIFVGLYDDLKRSPRQLLGDVHRFLDVDPRHCPESVEERVLPASMPRADSLFWALKRFALWLRRNDLQAPLNWAKSNPMVLKALTRPVTDETRPTLSAEVRQRLVEIYRPHMARTAEMLGRDLSGWMSP